MIADGRVIYVSFDAVTSANQPRIRQDGGAVYDGCTLKTPSGFVSEKSPQFRSRTYPYLTHPAKPHLHLRGGQMRDDFAVHSVEERWGEIVAHAFDQGKARVLYQPGNIMPALYRH